MKEEWNQRCANKEGAFCVSFRVINNCGQVTALNKKKLQSQVRASGVCMNLSQITRKLASNTFSLFA